MKRLACLALTLALSTSARAATLTWDANTGTAGAQDGLGTWNTATANWYNGTANVLWPNATDTAVFGAGTAGAYTITLPSTVNAGAITFNQSGYTLSGSGAITLSPPPALTPNFVVTTAASGGTDTLSSTLAGVPGTILTKTGPGALAVSSVTGGTAASPTIGIVTGGTYNGTNGYFDSILSIPYGNAFGTAPTAAAVQFLLDAGTLQFTGTNSFAIGTTRTTKISTAGGAIIDAGGNKFDGPIVDNAGSNTSFYFSNPAGTTSTFESTAVISGPGGVTLNGFGTTVFQAPNTYTGATTVKKGTLLLNGGALPNTNATVAPGATLSLQGGYVQFNLSISSDRLAIQGNLTTAGLNYVRLAPGNLNSLTLGTYPVLTAAGTLNLTGTYQLDGGASLTVPSTSAIIQMGGTTIPDGNGASTGGTTGGAFYRLTPQPASNGIQYAVTPAPSTVINVMPLGSSITEGISASPAYAGGGYRSQLYQSLVNDGRFSPNFEGSNTVLDNATPSGYNVLSGANQLHHEGHGGYTTSQILTNLNANAGTGSNGGGFWLASSNNGVNPDYVTLSIGGNDYGGDGTQTTQPVSRTDAIATYIQQLRPASNVLIANLFYRTQTTTNASGQTVLVGDLQNTYYNPAIPGVVYNHVLAGQHVSFVDTTAVTPNNSTVNIGGDGIHPLVSGYQIMAGAWYNAIAFGSAYWTGSQDSQWSTVNAGQSNFAQNYQRAVPRQTAPDAAADVYFNNNAGALPTTLGADLSVRSVNFAAGAAGPVTVGGNNTLTIGAGGITAQQNTGAHTISANVVAGVAQTWGNVSSNTLTISGNITGTGKITTTNSYTIQAPVSATSSATAPQTGTGTGTIVMSGGANTNSGGVTVDSGKLIVNTTAGSGPVSVGKSGVLINSGSISGDVTVDGIASGTGAFAGAVTVDRGGALTGAATIAGTLSIDAGGLVDLSSGTLVANGGVVNNGTVRLTHGAVLAVNGDTLSASNGKVAARQARGAASVPAFINNGTLDIISGGISAPEGFTNNGVVIDSRVVAAKSVSLVGGALTLTVDGYTGHTYQLQRSDSLAGGAFTNLGASQTGATGSVLTFQDASPSSAQGFYRVQVDP